MMSCLERSGRGKQALASRPQPDHRVRADVQWDIDTSLLLHIERAKANGVTATEMSEALTQLAFYAGWPKAWAALRMAKDVYGEE